MLVLVLYVLLKFTTEVLSTLQVKKLLIFDHIINRTTTFIPKKMLYYKLVYYKIKLFLVYKIKALVSYCSEEESELGVRCVEECDQ